MKGENEGSFSFFQTQLVYTPSTDLILLQEWIRTVTFWEEVIYKSFFFITPWLVQTF